METGSAIVCALILAWVRHQSILVHKLEHVNMAIFAQDLHQCVLIAKGSHFVIPIHGLKSLLPQVVLKILCVANLENQINLTLYSLRVTTCR